MRHLSRFFLFALLLALLSSCATPAVAPTVTATPLPTDTPKPSPSPSSTPTEAPTATPKPAWQQTLETQDSQDKFFKVENGQITANLYCSQVTIKDGQAKIESQDQKSIVLDPETIKLTSTTEVLYPNIISAKDAEGNQYLFNPDLGWFKVPEVPTDTETKLADYAPVTEDYFADGRFAEVSAFKYAENPPPE